MPPPIRPIRGSAPRVPAAPRPIAGFEGVLLVDKPAGPTSHDIVDAIRALSGIRKVGHGGTLDPQATGLLVMLLGRATKLSSRFLSGDKTYEGVMRLGIATDSQDAQGEVVRETDPSGVTEEDVLREMAAMVGDIYQMPPMVSAVKIDGVPLYKRARKGQVVERKPRLVHIYSFSPLSCELPRVFFRVRCARGTYVRTLCADIGDALGCGAHLETLRRTACGSLQVQNASPLTDIMDWSMKDFEEHVLPISQFL
jgi:tRNA pseudouridine55 synthase